MALARCPPSFLEGIAIGTTPAISTPRLTEKMTWPLATRTRWRLTS